MPQTQQMCVCIVISPDLIREVEARMNRNYLPPSLNKLQQHTQNCGGQSPPSATQLMSCSPPGGAAASAVPRRLGRTCKLPTVQEVGKYLAFGVL
jgi:hypothetical protein